jgi:hypothetical protein
MGLLGRITGLIGSLPGCRDCRRFGDGILTGFVVKKVVFWGFLGFLVNLWVQNDRRDELAGW